MSSDSESDAPCFRRSQVGSNHVWVTMLEAETKPVAKARRPPFGNTVDPVEAGRAGGIASGEARRAKRGPRYWGDVLMDEVAAEPERIVRNLLRSRNGAALAKALEFVRDLEAGKLQRLRDVDERTTQLDNLCCQLMDDVAREQRTKAALQAENITLMQERRELERMRNELRAEVAAEADVAGYDLVDDDEEATDAVAPQTAA
jgi:hypothetical protein